MSRTLKAKPHRKCPDGKSCTYCYPPGQPPARDRRRLQDRERGALRAEGAARGEVGTDELLKDVRDVVKATMIGEMALVTDRIESLNAKVDGALSTKWATWFGVAATLLSPFVTYFLLKR